MDTPAPMGFTSSAPTESSVIGGGTDDAVSHDDSSGSIALWVFIAFFATIGMGLALRFKQKQRAYGSEWSESPREERHLHIGSDFERGADEPARLAGKGGVG